MITDEIPNEQKVYENLLSENKNALNEIAESYFYEWDDSVSDEANLKELAEAMIHQES